MATKKRKVKKNRSGAWTAVYVVLLTLWILFLAAVCLYILSQVWAYASVYDDTQKEPVIEAYMAKLYDEVIALYRLQNVSFEQPAADDAQDAAPQSTAQELGPLPSASVALLSTLAGVWLLLGLFALRGLIKKKQGEKRRSA